MGARAPVQEAERRIKGIEAQIAELRDKLNPMSTNYVLGGNSTAGPGAVLEVEEQLRVLDGQLGEARTAAAEAETLMAEVPGGGSRRRRVPGLAPALGAQAG